jgi:hypothetical protein
MSHLKENSLSNWPQDSENCACTWSRDPVTYEAWLCVAGNDATIKVYNVQTAKLVKVSLEELFNRRAFKDSFEEANEI